ncbi:MAG TPA: GNAT family N-acetyltransferase [Actinomycetota bacterium]|nr:GNAT family N-acetyltransferase [Actinomycetota bacterium]
MPDVHPLKEQDSGLAGSVLSRALQHDPLRAYIIPDAAERLEKSPASLEPFVRLGLSTGAAWSAGSAPEGVLIAQPPGFDVTPEIAAEIGLMALPSILGTDAWIRQGEVFEYLEEHHRNEVQGPHWYVAVVGVNPARQRQGIGRELFATIFAEADRTGTPVYLDTAQPLNRAFFESVGLELIFESVHPASGLNLQTYRRGSRLKAGPERARPS